MAMEGNGTAGCGLNAAAGAGISIGAVAFLVAAAIAGVWIYRRGLSTGERQGRSSALRAVFP